MSLHPTLAFLLLAPAALAASDFASHAPMRPLPSASQRPLPAGPLKFVDATKGSDASDGSEAKPWRTLGLAVTKLAPGDTLILRGGTYYESVTIRARGTAEQPITIRAHPGELAIIDAGFREFYESPATAWEPFPQGGEGEYRSTKSYAAGGGFGNFGDSMVPFHRYMTFADLRSTNELWHAGLENRMDDPGGVYAGPGTRRDPETRRIHIRLAHTRLAGLGASAYRGETDPRKLPLVIAGEGYTITIERAAHLRLQDLVVRGAKNAAVKIEAAEEITLEGVTLYGGNMALRIHDMRGLRLADGALRGHAAPWHSRFHHKNRAGSGYLITAQGACTGFEFTRSEFTDHHDFFAFASVDEVRFHHNYVENFNDDGFEPGPKRERGRIFISQNYLSRCLSPLTAHAKKPNPVASEPGSGIYLHRNIFDLRRGTYKAPPALPDPSGAFLNQPTELIAHDHGSPTHAVAYVYHNTFLMQGGAWRGYYAFTWGAHTRGTTRRVFNNIFAQVVGAPGMNFSELSPEDDFQSDGNLFWSRRDGAGGAGDLLAKFRQSSLFEASRQRHAPGLGAGDLLADPKFLSWGVEGEPPFDPRLGADSAAAGSGVALPPEWPDPLRSASARVDVGAIPSGTQPWRIGVHGRLDAFGQNMQPDAERKLEK